jgi:NAD-dependent deacetylase
MERKKIAVLTGAGISAESGLKTFRDSDGLWEGYDVTEVATPRAWKKNPQLVLDFYNMRRRDVAKAFPNKAHFGLAELQNDFDVQVITQNIDDLHERAGSKKVLHLHGEIFSMRSEKNPSLKKQILGDMFIGDLAEDGGQFRPDIVWFEEPVSLMEEAVQLVRDINIFIVAGTSLVVYPAAGLLHYVDPAVPKFIIDKKIPFTAAAGNITAIEKPATEGIDELITLLKKF